MRSLRPFHSEFMYKLCSLDTYIGLFICYHLGLCSAVFSSTECVGPKGQNPTIWPQTYIMPSWHTSSIQAWHVQTFHPFLPPPGSDSLWITKPVVRTREPDWVPCGFTTRHHQDSDFKERGKGWTEATGIWKFWNPGIQTLFALKTAPDMMKEPHVSQGQLSKCYSIVS